MLCVQKGFPSGMIVLIVIANGYVCFSNSYRCIGPKPSVMCSFKEDRITGVCEVALVKQLFRLDMKKY